MSLLFGSPKTLENIAVYEEIDRLCIGASFPINQGIIFIVAKVFGLRTVMWWTGTDALKYRTVWHWRWRMKLLLPFIDEHRSVSHWIADELNMRVDIVPILPSWIHYGEVLLNESEPQIDEEKLEGT